MRLNVEISQNMSIQRLIFVNIEEMVTNVGSLGLIRSWKPRALRSAFKME